MLLAAFLLIGAPHAATPHEAPARPEIMSGYQQFFADIDADGDGKLSLSEWAPKVREPHAVRPRPASNHSELRAYLIGAHRRMDSDRDGKVTFDELIREPLANFDCTDSDRDLRLSQAEIESGRKRCPSGPAVRIGFISGPPANDTPDQ